MFSDLKYSKIKYFLQQLGTKNDCDCVETDCVCHSVATFVFMSVSLPIIDWDCLCHNNLLLIRQDPEWTLEYFCAKLMSYS